jgi:hypothetical protein
VSLCVLCGLPSRDPQRESRCPRGFAAFAYFAPECCFLCNIQAAQSVYLWKCGRRRWRRSETVSNNELHHSHECNGDSVIFLGESLKFEVSSVKPEGPGADAGGQICKTNPICPKGPGGPPSPLDPPVSDPRRRRLCKTNPISPRRGRLMEGIAQNETKLRGTGVCGQRQSSCGAWPGRAVKRAKRTQFPATPRGGGQRGAGRAANAQNEPNLPGGPPSPLDPPASGPRRRRLCKTNPISPTGTRPARVKFEVSSVKPERSAVRSSDFKLHTSNSVRKPARLHCPDVPTATGGAGNMAGRAEGRKVARRMGRYTRFEGWQRMGCEDPTLRTDKER